MKQDDSTYESLDAMASSLPYGHERTMLREKAINLADLTGDERLQFEARKEFVNDVCSEGGFTEKYFTVFPWLLNYAQSKGSDNDKMMVLWYYKWVVGEMAEMPVVTKTQIVNALEDLRKRYIEYGSNEKVYHQYAYDTYMYLGDFEKSRYHYQRWTRFKNMDYLDDCEACVVNRAVVYQSKVGTIEEALKLAQPLVTGKLKCTHVPKITYSSLLASLLRRDDQKLAPVYAERLYKLLITRKFGADNYFAYPALIYYSREGDLTKAIKIFERYMKVDVEQKNLFRRFYFYIGALYMFSKIDKSTIKLKLPQKTAFFSVDNTYDVATLREWFDKQTNVIGAMFDKRNGNESMSGEKKELLGL